MPRRSRTETSPALRTKCVEIVSLGKVAASTMARLAEQRRCD
jgi:hypothetical protein